MAFHVSRFTFHGNMALHLPILGECNIGCVFCSAWGRGGSFEMGYLKNQISKDSTGHVQISGGDPLLKNPLELLELLAHCKKLKKIVELQTNATNVARYDFKRLSQMIRLVNFFNVNFSAHDPDLDFAVTRARGAFEKRLAGVRRLIRMKAQVRLTYIVHITNYTRCETFARFVKQELAGVSWVQFSFVKGMGRARNSGNVMPRYEDAAPYLLAGLRACQALDIPFDVDHIPVCFVAEFKDHHVDYRKMREGKQGVHLAEKQKVADCAPCELKQWCPGPRLDYTELYENVKILPMAEALG